MYITNIFPGCCLLQVHNISVTRASELKPRLASPTLIFHFQRDKLSSRSDQLRTCVQGCVGKSNKAENEKKTKHVKSVKYFPKLIKRQVDTTPFVYLNMARTTTPRLVALLLKRGIILVVCTPTTPP